MDTVRAERLLGVMYRLGLSRDGGGVDVTFEGVGEEVGEVSFHSGNRFCHTFVSILSFTACFMTIDIFSFDSRPNN